MSQNLEPFLGVRFLASEYATGKTHSGRIDTLGIDENRCPVIIEYKRSVNENVVSQGLFYLDWLLGPRFLCYPRDGTGYSTPARSGMADLFALRFGGLRCPSEHLALKLGHVDWSAAGSDHQPRRSITEGKESRSSRCSRSSDLLEQAFDEAPEGAEFIRRYRDTNANLRTQLKRIIRKAGLEPWPKLFQNLRASRETELAEEYPAPCRCGVDGAQHDSCPPKHYLQVRDSDFDKASAKSSAE